VLSVLLIACINVAGLLMARGYTRQPELVVRTAIGAGRGRLVRQLLTESLVLAIIGGVTGVAAAALMLDTLVANIPMTLPANSPARMNAAVLGYATALTLVTGVLFGLQPALRMTGRRSRPMVPVSGRVTGSLLTRRGGQILIGAEIVLAVVLVAGAGLMVRSLRHILDVDMGFDPASFMAMEVTLVDEGVDATRYYASLADTIRAMPGVEAVGAGDQVPLMGASLNVIVRGPDGTPGPVNARRVGRGYFHALGLPVVAGRDFNDDDIRAATVSSVVLGEAAARELFADTLALGRRITFQDAELEVVGVVRDIRHWGPLREGETEIYLPSGPALPMSLPEFGMTMVVRPTASVPVTADRLRHAAISIGPRVVVEDIRSGRDLYGATITTSRQRTVLLSLLGGLGLVLALVGIFGMTAYAVARRTREIGVRIALGARPDHVVRRMVADAAWPIAIGTVLGLGAATMATRVIESFLFETTPTDPVTFAAVAIVLATSGLVAAWVPARRAARVDPVAALRAE
jgi:predicted permease